MSVGKEPFASPVFVCDDMVGALAKLLRTIGYFAYFFRKSEDAWLVQYSADNGYVLLTRDTLILPRRNLGAHLFIKSDHADEQLCQVVSDLRLETDPERFYSICLVCYEKLTTVSREGLRGIVPPYVYETQNDFSQYPACNRVYWPATHKSNMEDRLASILKKCKQ